jgi:hypothetical protein
MSLLKTIGNTACCGTVMIYCGAGSYLGKIFFPLPAPLPVPDPKHGKRLKTIFSTFFYTKKCVQNLAFLLLEAAMFLIKLPSRF